METFRRPFASGFEETLKEPLKSAFIALRDSGFKIKAVTQTDDHGQSDHWITLDGWSIVIGKEHSIKVIAVDDGGFKWTRPVGFDPGNPQSVKNSVMSSVGAACDPILGPRIGFSENHPKRRRFIHMMFMLEGVEFVSGLMSELELSFVSEKLVEMGISKREQWVSEVHLDNM